MSNFLGEINENILLKRVKIAKLKKKCVLQTVLLHQKLNKNEVYLRQNDCNFIRRDPQLIQSNRFEGSDVDKLDGKEDLVRAGSSLGTQHFGSLNRPARCCRFGEDD